MLCMNMILYRPIIRQSYTYIFIYVCVCNFYIMNTFCMYCYMFVYVCVCNVGPMYIMYVRLYLWVCVYIYIINYVNHDHMPTCAQRTGRRIDKSC